jgi:carbonic anhydrase
VFDRGLGDLFVVRTAGNVPSDYEIASLEYAVKHLGSTLIVVLGHERCGAVDAAVKDVQESGHLSKLLKALEQSVKTARNEEGSHLDNAIRQNVRDVVEKLRHEEVLKPLVKSGKIQVVGAYYDLETGVVKFLKN